MFQHFGLMDVFCGLWKRKWRIVVIAVVAVIIAFANVILSAAKDYRRYQENAADKISYTEKLSLIVEALDVPENGDVFGQSQKIRDSYAYALRSDIFSQYLIQTVAVDHWQDMLLKNNAVAHNAGYVPSSNMDIRAINEAVNIEAAENTNTIEITFSCIDQEIGKQIVDAYSTYATKNLRNKMLSAEVKELGRTTIENQDTEKLFFNKTTYLKNAVREALVLLILLELIYCLIVFTILLIKPVINRKADLSEYEIPNVWNL